MIFVTGDIHGNPFPRVSTDAFPEQKEMTKDDFVIFCGDFGLVWSKDKESAQEKYFLDDLENRNFTTLFCDGNHENFDRLNSYPVETWNGGKVHKLRPHVIHLMRGQVYTIDGQKFFVFGGARSHDIHDGVLEPDDPRRKTWRNDYSKLYRVNHISWWEQEMPSQGEMEEGIDNLEANNYKVDFIITHDMPSSDLTLFCALYGNGFYKADILNDYLEGIRAKTDYKRWFCGHYHDDRQINSKEIVLYEQIVRIS